MFSVIKSTPLHSQMYEILKNQILTGMLKAGEKIHENKIAQNFGVSRSPIREALRMLQQDGLVYSMSDRLTVTSLTLEDVEKIYQCRLAMEGYAARLCAARITEELAMELYDCIEKAIYYHEQKNSDHVIHYNTMFHDGIIQGCNNEYLQSLIDRNKALVLLARSHEFRTYMRSGEYLKEHLLLLEVMKKHDSETAEATMREHILNDWAFYKKNYNKQLNT